MDAKTKVIIGVVALAGAFATGRYTVPVKVVTEVKTVEVEKKQSKSEAERVKHRVTKIVEKKDGSKETTITEDTDTSKKTDSSSKSTSDSDNKTSITRGIGANIAMLGGVRLDGTPPVFGASISKPVLGPITSGLWLLSDKTIGISIGIQF